MTKEKTITPRRIIIIWSFYSIIWKRRKVLYLSRITTYIPIF